MITATQVRFTKYTPSLQQLPDDLQQHKPPAHCLPSPRVSLLVTVATPLAGVRGCLTWTVLAMVFAALMAVSILAKQSGTLGREEAERARRNQAEQGQDIQAGGGARGGVGEDGEKIIE